MVLLSKDHSCDKRTDTPWVQGDAAVLRHRRSFCCGEDAVKLSLEQEERVTTHINALVSMAKAESDYATDNFLQWFIKEQLEEVASIEQLLRLVQRAGEGNLLRVEECLARCEKSRGVALSEEEWAGELGASADPAEPRDGADDLTVERIHGIRTTRSRKQKPLPLAASNTQAAIPLDPQTNIRLVFENRSFRSLISCGDAGIGVDPPFGQSLPQLMRLRTLLEQALNPNSIISGGWASRPTSQFRNLV